MSSNQLKKTSKSAVTMQKSQIVLFVTSQEGIQKHVFLYLLIVAYFCVNFVLFTLHFVVMGKCDYFG